MNLFNPFQASVSLWYPLKPLEKLSFAKLFRHHSDVFIAYSEHFIRSSLLILTMILFTNIATFNFNALVHLTNLSEIILPNFLRT